MITCSSCGHLNQDGYNFCEKCGNNLKLESSVNNETLKKDISENQTIDNKAPASGTSPVSPSDDSKKKGGVKKAILAVAVIFIMYILLSNIILAFSPSAKLLKGINDFGKFSKFTSEASVSINYKGSNEVLDLLDNLKITGIVSSDIEKKLVETSVTFLYKNKNVTELKAGANDKLVWLDPLKLYKDKFYFEFDSEVSEISKEYDIYRKAIDKISLNFNEKEYVKIVKSVLGKNLKNSLGKVTVTLDADIIVELLDEIIDYARDDKKLMKSIRKEGLAFIKYIMQQGNKGKLDTLYDEDSFEEALEFFEDEDEFEDAYDMLLKSMQSGLKNSHYFVDELDEILPKIEITLHYGLFNKLNKVTCNFTVNIIDYYSDEKLVFDYNITTKKGAKFTNFNTKKAKNLEKIIDDPEEMMDIGLSMAENLIDSITDNKDLRKELEKIEDQLGIDIEDIIDYLEYGFPVYGW